MGSIPAMASESREDFASGRSCDFRAALPLVVICAAGSIRYVLGMGDWIYYVAILALFVVFVLGTERVRFDIAGFSYLATVLLLVGWLTLSVIWTVSTVQWISDEKSLMAIVAVSVLTSLVYRNEMLTGFLASLVLAGMVVSGYVFLHASRHAAGMGADEGLLDSYLTLSSTIAAAFLVSVMHALHAKRGRAWWSMAAVVLMLALGQSLGRGALVSSIGLVLLIGAYHVVRGGSGEQSRSRVFAKYLLFGLPVLAGLLVMALSVERTADRLARMLDVQGELQEGGRGPIWESAWHYIGEAPIAGHGLGSSGLLTRGDESSYPHNFLLQLWLDGGVVAALLGIALVGAPLWAVWQVVRKMPYEPQALSLFVLLLFYVAEFSKSFTFYNARSLMVIAVMAMSYSIAKKYGSKETKPSMAVI